MPPANRRRPLAKPWRLTRHPTTDRPEAWVTQQIGDRWLAAFRVVRQGDRWVVAEARVFPAEPDYGGAGEWSGREDSVARRGLTKQVLRAVQPHMWLHHAYEGSGGGDTFWGALIKEALGPARSRRQSAPTSAPRRGRRPLEEVFLARVAADYERAVQKGARPVQAIAERHGKTVECVRGWVHAARKRGFLSPSVQGKTEGRLTPAGMHVLESADKRRR